MLVVKTGCTEAGVGQVRGSPLWRRMPYSVLFSKELFLFSSCNQKARLSAFVTLSLPCSYSFLLRIDYLSQKKKKKFIGRCVVFCEHTFQIGCRPFEMPLSWWMDEQTCECAHVCVPYLWHDSCFSLSPSFLCTFLLRLHHSHRQALPSPPHVTAFLFSFPPSLVVSPALDTCCLPFSLPQHF